MKALPRNERLLVPAREAALQMLYAMDQNGQSSEEVELWYLREHPLAADQALRAHELVRDALARREQVAALVNTHARDWRWERMSLVDRNVLLVGVVELLRAPADAAPVIRDCALLARRFSQPAAIDFVQGVLRAIAATLLLPAAPTHAE